MGQTLAKGLRSHTWLVSSLQSLSIKTSSLAEAENMADLVDGYCRLQGEHKGSLIIHPKKGEFPFKGKLAQWADVAQAPSGRAREAKPLTSI